MDPRQPPPTLPFSRNPAASASSSPFTRASYPPSTTTTAAAAAAAAAGTTTAPAPSPYPPSSQQRPSATPAYADLPPQRRTSDAQPFYGSSRAYQPDSSARNPSAHARHQSASSLPSASSLSRTMPPPGSPPQPGQGPSPHQVGQYGLPAPRPPPVSVGPPSAFPSSRELPALSSLPRTGTGSSMSISSMLGGPPLPAREPPVSYASNSAGGHGPSFGSSVHASPRMSTSSDYPPFRRPHTPDHQRVYDARDARGSAAGSPQGVYATTPELQRYGTPQAYGQRGPPSMSTDQARDQARMAGGPIPRPSSQPKSYPSVPPPRPMEVGRPGPADFYGRREELGPGVEYNPERPVRVVKYDEPRYMADRERQERDMAEQRERERRERTMSGGDAARPYPPHQQEYGHQRNQPPPPPPGYGRQRDPRDAGPWGRQPFEQPRGPYDHPAPHPRQPEYPPTSGPVYGGHPAPSYAQPTPADRYPPSSHPGQPSSQPGPYHPHPLDSPEYRRLSGPHPQQPAQRRSVDEPPPPSVAYSGGGPHPALFGSPRARAEELPPSLQQQRSFLGVQEINRKGRISPLPQAVQGAQPQLQGPAAEPGIKSEFGRMFAGIGNGVGGFGVGSPITSGAQLPFANAAAARRDDADAALQDAVENASGKVQARSKRRKTKDEDGRGDDDGTGRLTPVGGRAKRTKTHAHHHHQYALASSSTTTAGLTGSSHHHHHHHHVPDQTSPAGATPFKNVKGSTPVPSPTGLPKDLGGTHHHHVAPRSTPHSTAPRAAAIVPIPKPKHVVSSQAVIDTVADRPRHHLGDVVYEPILKPARVQDPRTGRPPRFAYASTPKPLPMDVIKDKENCTLTVKVGKQHLTPAAREEITSRRAVWGTDVYTDDSDVIAACIHAGWIRGEWPEDVDVDMLDLDQGIGYVEEKPAKNGKKGAKQADEQAARPDHLAAPPKTGPVDVPENRDMHVTILVLPRLEKYASTTRFGLRSREFGGKLGRDGGRAVHDGLSFMVTAVRFLTNGAAPQSRLRGEGRRERMRKALQDVEMGRVWEMREVQGMMNSGSGIVSLARERPPPKGSEGDKENRPEAQAGQKQQPPPPPPAEAEPKAAPGPAPAGDEGRQEPEHDGDGDSGVADISEAVEGPGAAATASTAAAPAEQ